MSPACPSWNRNRCSTNCGRTPRARNSPGDTSGVRATSFYGITAARCTGAIPLTPLRAGSCTGRKSGMKLRPGRNQRIAIQTPETATEKPRVRSRGLSAPRVVLGLLCLLYLVLFFVRVAISGVAPLIKTDLRLSNTQLGLVFSAFAIPYAIFQLIGGWIGDRWGARMVLCVSCGVVAAAAALTGAVTALSRLFAVRLAWGFGEGATFATAPREMSSWIPEDGWG